MSDSTGGDISDLDDMDDIEMIMQQLQSDQEQAAESSHHRNYIYRECLDAEERIENYSQTHHPLPPHFDFFKVRPDAMGLPGFSVIVKCTSAIRQLAYDVIPDALAEKSSSSSFRCPRWSGCRDASDGHRGPGVVFLPYTIIVPCVTSTEATDSGPESSFVGSASPECCFGGDYLLRKLQRKIYTSSMVVGQDNKFTFNSI
ncbi:hypothetical protein Tco_1087011 [Tanacetum coccineum]